MRPPRARLAWLRGEPRSSSSPAAGVCAREQRVRGSALGLVRVAHGPARVAHGPARVAHGRRIHAALISASACARGNTHARAIPLWTAMLTAISCHVNEIDKWREHHNEAA